MKLKISFSSVDANSDPMDWIYRMEDIGFQGFEILDEGRQKVDGVLRNSLRNIHETTDLILSLHAPLSDINIASVNERMREESIRQIKESIENTYEFIDNICVVHPGTFSPLSMQMPEKAIQKSVAALITLCEFAADRGLRIAVENLTSANMLMGRYPDELIQIVRSARMDNLGVCVDIAHANTTKKLDEFLGITAKAEDVEIIHLHASDNFGTDDLHLPLGQGNQDWNKVMRGINNNGYEGVMVLELYTLNGGIESLEFINDYR